MPRRSPGIPMDWGRLAVFRARQAQGWSRPALAARSGVAESTIRNVELGRHQPTPATILPLCKALDLPLPISGNELQLWLGWLEPEAALPVLCQALQEFAAKRANPEAFARRTTPEGVERELALATASEDFETAHYLLQLLTAQGAQMTEPGKKHHINRWRNKREAALLTQEELATRAGLSLKKLKAIEAGQEEPTPKERSALNAVIDDGPAQRG